MHTTLLNSLVLYSGQPARIVAITAIQPELPGKLYSPSFRFIVADASGKLHETCASTLTLHQTSV